MDTRVCKDCGAVFGLTWDKDASRFCPDCLRIKKAAKKPGTKPKDQHPWKSSQPGFTHKPSMGYWID